jgi:carbonic anhydrase
MNFRFAHRFIPLVAMVLVGACGGAPAPVPNAAPATTSADHPPPAAKAHFSYANPEGPDHWGDLDPAFATCKSGTKQSPVNLPSVLRTDSSLAITRPMSGPIPLVVVNNGHAIQVKNTAAASVTIDNVKYDLAQFHFHSPSEHTIGGKSFDMEMHLVHKSADGKLAVIALLFTKGAENQILKPLWASMPSAASEDPTTVDNVSIDVARLYPNEMKFEHYEGSLTTPPCTESVSWFVLEPPAHGGLEMSAEQISRYQALMHGPTNRPVQPLNGRTVVEATAAQ